MADPDTQRTILDYSTMRAPSAAGLFFLNALSLIVSFTNLVIAGGVIIGFCWLFDSGIRFWDGLGFVIISAAGLVVQVLVLLPLTMICVRRFRRMPSQRRFAKALLFLGIACPCVVPFVGGIVLLHGYLYRVGDPQSQDAMARLVARGDLEEGDRRETSGRYSDAIESYQSVLMIGSATTAERERAMAGIRANEETLRTLAANASGDTGSGAAGRSVDTQACLSLMARATSMGGLGLWDQEVADCTAVIGMPQSSDELKSQAAMECASAEMHRGKYDAAIENFSWVISHPASPRQTALALLGRAQLYGIAGKSALLVADLDALLQLSGVPPNLRSQAQAMRASAQQQVQQMHTR